MPHNSTIFLFIAFFLVNSNFTKNAFPFTYQSDSVIIRAILDSNGYKDSFPDFIHPQKRQNENRITRLNFYPHIISKLPGLDNLDSLKRLNLEYTHINPIPSEIGNLRSLNYLNLSGNNLTELPFWFGRLSMLDTLVLSGNKFSRFPVAIYSLKGLKNLSVNGNMITDISSDFAGLSKLIDLDLSGNPLRKIPVSVFCLKNLRSLKLNSIMLDKIPPQIGNLSGLIYLSAADNQLTEIPEAISQLKNIETLELRDNKLTCLPGIISQNNKLFCLSATNNSLKNIPKQITTLSHLQFLQLSKNKIIDLPGDWEKLENLLELDLSDNLLKNLPDDLHRAPHLRRFQVSGNTSADLGNVFFKRLIAEKTREYKTPNQIIVSDPIDSSLGYIPLSIGNYWKFSNGCVYKVVDMVINNGVDFYNFQISNGSDMMTGMELWIDGKQIVYNGSDPKYRYEIADFTMNPGDINLGNEGNLGVIWKSKDQIVFQYYSKEGMLDWLTFKKGLGFFGNNIEEIKINSKIYKCKAAKELQFK
jgi:Leucine-rich repeat (LRR) protein